MLAAQSANITSSVVSSRSWLHASVPRSHQVVSFHLSFHLSFHHRCSLSVAPPPPSPRLFLLPRAVYRVASVQPVISTYSPVLQPPSPRLPSLPPPPHKYSSLPPSVLALPTQCPVVASSEPSSQMHPYPPLQHHLQPHMSSQSGGQHHPSPQSQSQSQTQTLSYSQARSQAQAQTQTQPSTPEQSGILDWLRRLRLHKYYPVFKQLTMEEVGRQTRQSHADHTPITRQSHANHTPITRRSHANHMPITRQSHARWLDETTVPGSFVVQRRAV